VVLALAVALEVTGPAQSVLLALRLPLVVLVLGAGWAEARWRWGGDSRLPSVPMATPCLIVSATAGVAAVTAKLVSISPVLAVAVLAAASACCCAAIGLLLFGGHAASAARSREAAAGRAPGRAVRPVIADA
jgi:hypothetical protein